MKKLILNISAVIIALMTIMAVGGVSVIHHYCGCMGEEISSLYIEDVCCETDVTEASCCKVEETIASCCAVEESVPAQHSCDGDCCHTDESYFRVADPFTTVSIASSVQLQPVTLDVREPLVEFSCLETDLDRNYNYRSHAPPPSSRKIITYLNRFKLSPPLVA